MNHNEKLGRHACFSRLQCAASRQALRQHPPAHPPWWTPRPFSAQTLAVTHCHPHVQLHSLAGLTRVLSLVSGTGFSHHVQQPSSEPTLNPVPHRIPALMPPNTPPPPPVPAYTPVASSSHTSACYAFNLSFNVGIQALSSREPTQMQTPQTPCRTSLSCSCHSTSAILHATLNLNGYEV